MLTSATIFSMSFLTSGIKLSPPETTSNTAHTQYLNFSYSGSNYEMAIKFSNLTDRFKAGQYVWITLHEQMVRIHQIDKDQVYSHVINGSKPPSLYSDWVIPKSYGLPARRKTAGLFYSYENI